MSKVEIEAKIEYQKEIGEASPGGYQPVRFTRVKYKASPAAHIDIRRFQRGYDDEGEEKYFPTKVGFRFPEREFRRVIEKYAVMPESYVHPIIVEKCFSLLSNGEYESAVIQAFKAIETTTRAKIGAPNDMFGERLLKKAFNPDEGLLTNYKIPKAERFAFLNYITGAFSYYRNSSTHRDIELDFVSAFDRIAVASDLLKAIEDAEVNV
ncbi:TIGR02391 family protein [Pseudoalteromonas sp. CO325X]|uniref:TIGR02391 family protein n=1 Tax=Pseudoalteromonas TaxID=53246 RepID=UPI001022AE85|nr:MULTISPECIES: TIGR02391 family protein [Pseudoalteromonas]RZF83595.1 TIGR02391 family protein [Pseudoalteromonas sp. CO325X]TMO47846.1 TIGR02391 family protein [Pseudoalteromonas ruthenica]TMO52747.1 TIGR02391 family protein [Pseudoalteromonas ruthenica]